MIVLWTIWFALAGLFWLPLVAYLIASAIKAGIERGKETAKERKETKSKEYRQKKHNCEMTKDYKR